MTRTKTVGVELAQRLTRFGPLRPECAQTGRKLPQRTDAIGTPVGTPGRENSGRHKDPADSRWLVSITASKVAVLYRLQTLERGASVHAQA